MRLIDADALLKQFSECNFKGYTMQKLIVNAPTIEVPRWIPVTARLPEKGNEYLCCCCIDGHTEYPFFMVLRYYLVDEKPHFQHECEHGLKVTHWMEIPKVTKDGDT